MGSMKASVVAPALIGALCVLPAYGQTTLYGVSGDGGSTPETLFTINMVDASVTPVLTLGNGNDGEEIAWHPGTGLIYHLSGRGDMGTLNAANGSIFESIDPGSLAVTPIPLATGFNFADPLFAEEAKGFTHDPTTGALLANDLDQNLNRLNLDGTSVRLGTTDHFVKALAFSGGTLYSLDNEFSNPIGARLRTLDPATGATLSTVNVTLPGFTVENGIGLAANPDDGQLWAILATGIGPTNRRLVTLDPATGVATLVGSLSIGIASITFAGDTVPACLCEMDGQPAQVDVFDLLAYLDLWFASDSAADIDASPGVDVFDLLAFLDCWFPASAGVPCP